MKNAWTVWALVITCSVTALAQGGSGGDGAPLWMRYPVIAPDGKTIVFSYRGDLYRVASDGGQAIPLTTWDGYDSRPVWSRDGRSIAYASDRFGNLDVFVVPATGGRSRRLTWHSAGDVPSDFTPDGKSVIFTSRRLDTPQNQQFPSGVLPELYAVDVDGGRPRQLLTVPADAAKFDAKGKRLIFQDRKGYEDPWRKHHTSSITRDIWIYDLASGEYTQLTERPGEDRNPLLAPDGRSFFFLSERDGSFNVFRAAIDRPEDAEALTRMGPHPVRFLSMADDGTLCFGYQGEIYTLGDGGRPRKVRVSIPFDDAATDPRTVSIRAGATEMAVSPSGKEVAFVVRGEVFVTSVETDVTKRVTNTPTQERSIDFSPDGRSIVYAGERDGSWNLYRTSIAREEEDYFLNATILEEEPVLVSDRDSFQPAFSPDGKEVAYLVDRTSLQVIDLESKKTRTILPAESSFSYADGDQYYQWSPDGKWFLVQYLKPEYWISEVGLVSASGDEEVFNLTESGYSDSSPKWMMEGKMLIWSSNRDGLQAHAKTGPNEADVYGMFLTQAAFDRFKLTKEELELLKEREKKEEEEKEKKEKKEKKKEGEGEKAEDQEEDEEEDDDDELPEVTIDLDGIRDRKARLTIHSSRLSDAVVTPDGEKLLYLTRFEKGYHLWQTELRTRETKILAELGARGGGALQLDKEGKHVFVLADGSLSRVEIDSGKRKGIAFAGDMRLDTAAERDYFFDHAWRQVREKFYDPDLHGADWDALYRAYRPFLAHINNDYDFAEMLGELLGELNASHTGARYRHSAEDADQTASLGLFYDESWKGDGLRVAEVMPKNPLIKDGSRLAAGIIIEKIDGVAIERDTNFYRLLNRRAGKYTLLSLHDPEQRERWDETVKPLGLGQENELLYQRWVEQRRKMTEERSGGRVGYLHVRGMNDPSYRVVQEEVLGRLANREAIVVDTRFNGGGDLVDDLSIFLSGRQYMDFVPPDGRSIGMEPSRRWTKPSIVLASEGNYSDAHCFPWAYKTLGIGEIVGMPVPGTCTFVWWERLQNRTVVFGVPNMAVTDVDGNPLENLQLEPDILVSNEYGQVSAGRDQQLETAIDRLLVQLNQP